MNITIPTTQVPAIEIAETTTTQPNSNKPPAPPLHKPGNQTTTSAKLVPKEKKDEINGGALGDRFSSSTARELNPSCVAEAYFLLGPTAKQEKSNANKSRLKPGYKSKLYKCKFEKCTMYWLLQAEAWDLDCPNVFVLQSQENHISHPNIGWSEHYEHLVSHHSNGTCDECPNFQQKIGLPGIFKVSALEIMNVYPNEAPFDIAKAVEKKFELSDLFKSIQVRKKIKEQIESFVRSVNRKVPSSSSLPLDGGGNQQVKDALIMVISGCTTIVSMPLISICISALLDKILCFVPGTSQRT
jgi:hypothetical protein